MTAARPAPAETQDARVTCLLEQANQRAASGESSQVVEQWLTLALQDIGMATTPPAWDVYAQARWKIQQNNTDIAVPSLPDATLGRPSSFVVTAMSDEAPPKGTEAAEERSSPSTPANYSSRPAFTGTGLPDQAVHR
jgi:hypothetical protein